MRKTIFAVCLVAVSSALAVTQAFYRHHQRTTTTALESDLQTREVGIDASARNCLVGKQSDGDLMHVICKESDTASLSGVLNVTGNTNLSATLKMSNYNQHSVPFFGSGGTVSEDGTNFTFNDSQDRLAVDKITVADSTTLTALTASSLVATDANKVLTSTVSGLSPVFTGLGLSGLTASSLVATDGSKNLTSSVSGLSPVFTGLTLTGNGSVGGTWGVTGLATLSGGALFNSNQAAAQGKINKGAVEGLTLRGIAGSSNDFTVYSADGGAIFANPTGTRNVSVGHSSGTAAFPGPVTMSSTLGVTGAATFSSTITSAEDITTTVAKSGSDLLLRAINSSNTASSGARLWSSVAGSAAGDAYTRYTVSGLSDWTTGLDNSDGDAYVISESSALGTANRLKIASGGALTVPGTVDVTGKLGSADSVYAEDGLRVGSVAASNVNWNRSGANMWNTPDSVTIGGRAHADNGLSTGGGEVFGYGDTSFTITANSGWTTGPSGTAYATRIGRVVVLTIPIVTGTGDGAPPSLGGIPSGWRPTRDQRASIGAITASGAEEIGTADVEVSTGGVLTFWRQGGWPGSGTTAIGNTSPNTITYNLQ